MQIVDTKINPKLLNPLIEILNRVEKKKRLRYVNSLLLDVERDIEKTRHHLKSKKKRL